MDEVLINFREKRRTENLLNSLNRDDFVYRIFSFERFLEVLQTNTLTLVKPSLWEDPFENFLLSCPVKYKTENGYITEKKYLELLKESLYGQCWTLEKESDAMWRIYSPNKKGVKVFTTVGKLWDAFYDSHKEDNPELRCYFGKVLYKLDDEIIKIFGENGNDLIFDRSGKGHPLSLLYKRTEFTHENEARLIYVAEKSMNEKNHSFAINPNDLFGEVVLDPRATSDIAEIIKNAIQEHGYKGEIKQSGLYKVEHLTIYIR